MVPLSTVDVMLVGVIGECRFSKVINVHVLCVSPGECALHHDGSSAAPWFSDVLCVKGRGWTGRVPWGGRTQV